MPIFGVLGEKQNKIQIESFKYRSGVKTMQRVNVTIDGKTYTIVAEDDESHILRSAELVDKSIRETKENGRLSSVDGAILAALNIADKYFKAQQSSDNMRAQIRSYADECAQLRSEIIKLKKQNKEG